VELTERDQHLFRWINGHGFVTVNQTSAWMGTNYQAAQRRMKKLVDAGYLQRKRLLHGDKRVHWVTKKALAASGDNLAPPQTIGLGSYRHDLVLVDVAQTVVDQTGGDFVPERRLRQHAGFKGVGVSGHLPDGLLRLPGQKPIAVELEMSTKGRQRLKRIVSGYAANMGLEQVWYFVTANDVRHVVEEAAKAHDFIKVLDWRRVA